ncbi:MAG: twin-arginine translocase TatA/TatE family subunit [Verrucomicrobiota bacterium]
MNPLPEPVAGIFGLGPTELIVILVILLLLFGGAKLPALAKGLGQSIKEFKNAAREDPKEEKKAETPPAKTGNN